MVRAAGSWSAVRDAEPRYFYRAYGLDISSVFPVPEFVTAEPGRDAAISIGRVNHSPPRRDRRYAAFDATGAAMYFSYPDAGTYEVRGGAEIVIDPIADAEDRLVRLFLTGPALAALLHQRGRLVLHASTVRVGAGAIGFLGGPMSGKSTTAAALHARGYPLVADDLMPVELAANGTRVEPGFPQFKLWPPSIEMLGGDPMALPPLRADMEKRAQRVRRNFEDRALPVAALYILAEGPDLSVEPLTGMEKAIELIRHSYFAPELAQLGEGTANFEQCLALSDLVPAFRLSRPRDPAQLAAMTDRLEQHLQAEIGAELANVRNL
jgi:hypothetical protein